MELNKFINLFTGVLNLDNVDKINKDTRFKNLKHWNAFCVLSLIVFVDVNFDKCISKNEIEKCDTVESLYTFIENK